METSFTPLEGLLGGGLIGLAAALLLLAEGRIAGISGVLGRSLFAAKGDLGWRLAFLAGLPVGAALVTRLGGDRMGFAISGDPLLLVTAGLLVGVGTQLGNGCTSGHGVCGIGRGSPRSIVATLVFMAFGMLTVFAMRHLVPGGA